MNMFKRMLVNHQEKVKSRNNQCDKFITDIDIALQEINDLFNDTKMFVDPSRETEWNKRYASLLPNVSTKKIKKIKSAIHFKTLIKKQKELYFNANSLKQRIINHNDFVANSKIQSAYTLIGNVEGRKLDDQQMLCIVKEAHNHLVIAGAGTGKTTTIVGKIKFLLMSGQCKSDDILVLSFTNASASEMSQRIKQETGCAITALTFHKLGLNILSKVKGTVPKITSMQLRIFIKEQLRINMKDEAYLRLLNSYMLFNRVVSKSEFEFKTQAEYDEYLKLNPPVTIQNEMVKSYGEMDIANFLLQNGIRYIYEEPYKIDTRTSEYGQYKPDFYLPDYDIYIEYFGINRSGQVPFYFSGSHGMTATESYHASMYWKREMHRTNNTTMIECYAYEKIEGNLLDNLKEKLINQSVRLSPKSAEELWNEVSADDESVLDGIIELLETVINLIKSNKCTIEELRRINGNNGNIQNNNIIISLVEPIFCSYCDYLREHDEIDFHDMVNMAYEYVRTDQFVNPYKYVIVDEYQDMSKSRFSLLEILRNSNDFDLFCVGDDWQSIYRFAGSNIGYILKFEQYWGPSEISRIETTYRFTQKLIEISGSFIMQNPAQIKKSIQGKADAVGFVLGEISGYTDKCAIEFMAKRLEDLPEKSSVFFIGRYSFDSKLLQESGIFKCQHNNANGLVDIKYQRRMDLDMKFVTAHKSKGLQSDYVFIINNKKSRMGFPSKIQGAAILNLLLDDCDLYPYAEERRLFYVALTRAKKKVFLVTVNGQESDFVMELKKRYGEELKREQFECPRCGGKLVRRSSSYGEFFGCSNYRTTGCQYKRNISRKGVKQ